MSRPFTSRLHVDAATEHYHNLLALDTDVKHPECIDGASKSACHSAGVVVVSKHSLRLLDSEHICQAGHTYSSYFCSISSPVGSVSRPSKPYREVTSQWSYATLLAWNACIDNAINAIKVLLYVVAACEDDTSRGPAVPTFSSRLTSGPVNLSCQPSPGLDTTRR